MLDTATIQECAARAIARAEASAQNLYSLGVDTPSDLDARLSLASKRAKLIGDSLHALVHSDLKEIDSEVIESFGYLALELSSEITAIHDLNIANSWREDLERAQGAATKAR